MTRRTTTRVQPRQRRVPEGGARHRRGIFDSRLPVAPLRYNHAPLPSIAGGPVGAHRRLRRHRRRAIRRHATAGMRRQGTDEIIEINDVLGFKVIGKTNVDCEGDSGGPAFLTSPATRSSPGSPRSATPTARSRQAATRRTSRHLRRLPRQVRQRRRSAGESGRRRRELHNDLDCASQICAQDGATDFCIRGVRAGATTPAVRWATSAPSLDDAGFCPRGRQAGQLGLRHERQQRVVVQFLATWVAPSAARLRGRVRRSGRRARAAGRAAKLVGARRRPSDCMPHKKATALRRDLVQRARGHRLHVAARARPRGDGCETHKTRWTPRAPVACSR